MVISFNRNGFFGLSTALLCCGQIVFLGRLAYDTDLVGCFILGHVIALIGTANDQC